MGPILSLSSNGKSVWAAGPRGLWAWDGATWRAVPQPQHHLFCCAVLRDRILVGGDPHGVAFSTDGGGHWQAAWIDSVNAPVVCLAPHPCVDTNGVLLAGTSDAGLLRSVDCGQSWASCNFGLEEYGVLALAWAPPAPSNAWPRWDIAFAATERSVYRSPNGGLAWRRCTGITGAVQTLAVAPDFHDIGLVLAGTEHDGLWRSTNGGRHFEPIEVVPSQVNALAYSAGRWVASDNQGLWFSDNAVAWESPAGSMPALALLPTEGGLWLGTESGVEVVLDDSTDYRWR